MKSVLLAIHDSPGFESIGVGFMAFVLIDLHFCGNLGHVVDRHGVLAGKGEGKVGRVMMTGVRGGGKHGRRPSQVRFTSLVLLLSATFLTSVSMSLYAVLKGM